MVAGEGGSRKWGRKGEELPRGRGYGNGSGSRSRKWIWEGAGSGWGKRCHGGRGYENGSGSGREPEVGGENAATGGGAKGTEVGLGGSRKWWLGENTASWGSRKAEARCQGRAVTLVSGRDVPAQQLPGLQRSPVAGSGSASPPQLSAGPLPEAAAAVPGSALQVGGQHPALAARPHPFASRRLAARFPRQAARKARGFPAPRPPARP